MSVYGYAWAWEQKVAYGEKLVLLAIAEHLNSETNEAFPSLRRLVRMTALSERHVRRCITSLVSSEYIERIETFGHGGRQTTNTYRFRTEVHPIGIGSPKAPDGSDMRSSDARFRQSVEGRMGDTDAPLDAQVDHGPDARVQAPPTPESPLSRTLSLNRKKEPYGGDKSSKAGKAHRLPEDWKPSPKQVADAKALGLTDTDIAKAAPEFRDYWTDRGGREACKISWDGTWRNRCRAIAERLGRRPPAQAKGTANLTRDDWRRAVDYFEETGNWMMPGPPPGRQGCMAPKDICENRRFL